MSVREAICLHDLELLLLYVDTAMIFFFHFTTLVHLQVWYSFWFLGVSLYFRTFFIVSFIFTMIP